MGSKSLTKRLEALGDQVTALTNRVETLEGPLQTVVDPSGKEESRARELKSANTEIAKLHSRISGYVAAEVTFEKSLADMKKKLSAAKDVVATKHAAIQQANQEHGRTRQKLKSAEEDLRTLNGYFAEEKEKYKNTSESLKNARSVLKVKDSEITLLKKELMALQLDKKSEVTTDEHAQLVEKYEKLQQEFGVFKATLHDMFSK